MGRYLQTHMKTHKTTPNQRKSPGSPVNASRSDLECPSACCIRKQLPSRQEAIAEAFAEDIPLTIEVVEEICQEVENQVNQTGGQNGIVKRSSKGIRSNAN